MIIEKAENGKRNPSALNIIKAVFFPLPEVQDRISKFSQLLKPCNEHKKID
jgi:hypothetical protein